MPDRVVIADSPPNARRAGQAVTPGPQAGVMLLEALIALVLLAVGLLGIAAVMLNGARYSTDAQFRSVAMIEVSSMVDRIRQNPGAIASYLGSHTTDPENLPNCDPTAASAETDLACWRRDLALDLPPGSVAEIALAAGNEYTISVQWNDRDAQSHAVRYRFEP